MQLNNLCGIDVGGTNIKMTAIVNGKQTTSTIPCSKMLTHFDLVETISNFYLSFDNKFSGLGIAVSGTTDGFSICRTSHLHLHNLSVDDFSHLQCPKVRLINDANAVALAGTLEYPDSKVLIGITSGTGIGCGVTINGKLFTGANGFAGEVHGNPIVLHDYKAIKVGKLCSGSKIYKEQIGRAHV